MLPHPKDVTSRLEMAEFVASLRRDLIARPDEWENADLIRFLDALSSYLEDVPGYCRNMAPDLDPEQASWRLFATVLMGAKVYE
jgi:hypothetical protein